MAAISRPPGRRRDRRARRGRDLDPALPRRAAARTDRSGRHPAEGEDPLAALFAEGPSKPPSDPALARLFPDAYGGPDRSAPRVRARRSCGSCPPSSAASPRWTCAPASARTPSPSYGRWTPSRPPGTARPCSPSPPWVPRLARRAQRPAPHHRHPAGGLRRGRGRERLALPAPRQRPAQAHGDGLSLARRAPGNARRNPDAVIGPLRPGPVRAYSARTPFAQRTLRSG